MAVVAQRPQSIRVGGKNKAQSVWVVVLSCEDCCELFPLYRAVYGNATSLYGDKRDDSLCKKCQVCALPCLVDFGLDLFQKCCVRRTGLLWQGRQEELGPTVTYQRWLEVHGAMFYHVLGLDLPSTVVRVSLAVGVGVLACGPSCDRHSGRFCACPGVTELKLVFRSLDLTVSRGICQEDLRVPCQCLVAVEPRRLFSVSSWSLLLAMACAAGNSSSCSVGVSSPISRHHWGAPAGTLATALTFSVSAGLSRRQVSWLMGGWQAMFESGIGIRLSLDLARCQDLAERTEFSWIAHCEHFGGRHFRCLCCGMSSFEPREGWSIRLEWLHVANGGVCSHIRRLVSHFEGVRVNARDVG